MLYDVSDKDRMVVEEMWTLARNEPLTMANLSPFGTMDRERYRRAIGKVILELTLDSDGRTGEWSYEFAVRHIDGETLGADIVNYWLTAFFGRESSFAARRNFLMTGEARYTFPYAYRR